MAFQAPQHFFRFLNNLETKIAHARGKGYGSFTVAQEIWTLGRLLTGSPPRLAIDVGGNVGEYTEELRRIYPSLEIHVFEPSAANVGRLTSRFGNDARIRVVPRALSDAEGRATLYSDVVGSGLASLTRRKLDHFNLAFDTQEDVATTRFEDYWTTELQGRPLDIVKLDVEGHELSVLRGFGSALAAVRVLQFEFGGCNIDTRTYFQDFWYYFKDQAFDLYRITPYGAERIPRYRETDEFFSTTNYVAVNRR